MASMERSDQKNQSSSTSATGGGLEQVKFRAPQMALSVKDFSFGKELGHGAYSKVLQARLKTTGQVVALKVMDKRHIIREKKVGYVKLERLILDQLSHPGVVALRFTFQDEYSLYMGLECCSGGELFDQILLQGKLSVEHTRFYTAQIVDILDYIHGRGVVHRDLKPENLLLTAEGHLKLADFGSAKLLQPLAPGMPIDEPEDRQASFVGTAEYVSPEVLNGGTVSIGSDFWALGCIVYQMLVGQPPFRAPSEYLCFQRVVSREFSFPDNFPADARDLIDRLLDADPNRRLGTGLNGFVELKAHPFFRGINWAHVRDTTPPPVLRRAPLSPAGGVGEPSADEPEFDDEEADDEWQMALLGGSLSKMTLNTPPPRREDPPPRTARPKTPTCAVEPSRPGEPRSDLGGGGGGGGGEGSTSTSPAHSPSSPSSPASPPPSAHAFHNFKITDECSSELWQRFAGAGQRLVATSLLKKHRGLSVKKRQFLLLSCPPRLMYVDPVSLQVMGDVPWSSDLSVLVESPVNFSIQTPKRTYVLEEVRGQAWQWKEAIERVMRESSSKH